MQKTALPLKRFVLVIRLKETYLSNWYCFRMASIGKSHENVQIIKIKP